MSKILILTFLFLNTSSLFAQQKVKFYCQSFAILKMDFFGELENNQLSSDLFVDIEGSVFIVDKKEVKLWNGYRKNIGKLFGFTTPKVEGQWIQVRTKDGLGDVYTDYRGITLNGESIQCDFSRRF
jgi:hypothetical protein